MAQLKNNDLTREPIENRLYRLLRMQNNIDTHAAELGITGPLLDWAHICHDEFSGAVTASAVEAGESKDATIVVRAKFTAMQDYYQKAKDILIAYLAQYKPDDILLASYRVDRPTPRKYLDLTEAIDAFEETHNRLVSAGDDRVIAQSIIDQLVALGNDFESEVDKAGIEKRESDVAYQEQHSIYNADTEKLRLIFRLACMVWGDDDPKLKDLGFVPSSEVWTPGGGEPSPEIGVPENVQAVVEGENVRISWDPVEGAEGYWLSHTQFPPLFLKIYEGEATEFLHELPDAGTHYYKVRAVVGDESGEFSSEVSAEVVVAPPAPPVMLIMEFVEDNKTKVSWSNPGGTYYDGCNLYSVDVPTGSPMPPMPAAPMFHDLFVYSVTLDVLHPGMTRYVWVTGVRRGMESAPAGPVWVSV